MKKWLLVWGLFVAVILLQLLCLAVYREQAERTGIARLIQKNPERESEIIDVMKNQDQAATEKEQKLLRLIEEKYGYDFLEGVLSKELFFAAGMTGISCGVLFLFFLYKEKKQKAEKQQLFEQLKEELQNIKKGNYELLYQSTAREAMELSGQEQALFEALQELAHYLEDLKEQLSKEENSTKAWVTDISHQLKTPLASLRMCHELTTSGELTEEEKQEFKEQERREIDKLELLLEELVKISRLEKHMVTLQPVCQSIQETISEAVSLVYGKAKGKQIEIQVELKTTPAVCHDPKWTAQALANVLDNAIKYSEEGSLIRIRGTALVTSLLIEIEDEGIGILPEELNHIFQRFYRGTKAAQKVKEGIGVGLYLTRSIIELQGGTICAKRKQEKGTIFKITLPL